ncbi:MAG: hypothetical protein FVQ82_13560 [Planctomycetes bacterium]|nr:hypothetical protein [Planctomycetota bacterium]
MRKVKIGLVAAAVVVIAFMIYSNGSKSRQIEVPDDKDGMILERLDFSNTSKIGDSSVKGLKKFGYITRDPITKKVVRVFGFEKLLNPEKNSEKWRLQKPYMEFYGDEFECKITSDEGNFQLEEVMNKITPQNGRLYGNVQIHITFQNEGVPTDGVIYLKDLDYDSERSELATDNSVNAVFADANMVGTGMILIYNSAKSRIEYFEMKDLEKITIRNLAMLSKDRKGGKAKTAAATESNASAGKAAVKTTGNAVVKTTGNAAAGPVVTAVNDTRTKPPKPEPVNDTQADKKQQRPADYYHCRFLEDVNIEYGNELVVVSREELNIKNLLFSQSAPEKASTAKPSAGKTPAIKPSKPASGNIADSKKDSASNNSVVSVKPDIVSAEPDIVSAEPGTVAVADAGASEETTEVVLTCKGGFIVQLMSNIDSVSSQTPPVAATFAETLTAVRDKAKLAKTQNAPAASGDHDLIYAAASAEMNQLPLSSEFASFAAAADAGGSKLAPVIQTKPTRFHARKIDFDMTTKYAYATGPIDLLIYGKADPNAGPDQPQIPINITASENAEYFGIADQIVFNGDIEGSRILPDGLYVTVSTVYGDKLVVDLDSSANKDSISHISVLGEDVNMLSTRKVSDPNEKINLLTIHTDKDFLTRISLKCQRIDYDAVDEFVLAPGPGEMVLNNSNAPAVESSNDDPNTQVTLKEPCYALMRDFDSLKWYTVKNKVVVEGSSDSVKIQHLPVVDGQYGKITFVAARNIEANFVSTLGRTALSSLTASNTVLFREEEGDKVINNFYGDKLFYDVANSLMLITGTENNPCMVNGFNTDKISYNLATGELVTNVSGPSTIQLPYKP